MSDFPKRLARGLDDLAHKYSSPNFNMLKDLAAVVRRAAAEPKPVEHWSEWIDWSGDIEPLLPLEVALEIKTRSHGTHLWTHNQSLLRWWHSGNGDDIVRFRYRCDEPGGWIKRPKGWTPPESAYPLEYRTKDGTERVNDRPYEPRALWDNVSHIRLLPRKPDVPELPKEWAINRYGDLCISAHRLPKELAQHPNFLAAIRAWMAHHGVPTDE